jgi:dienelactone hydrolase
VKAEIPMKTFVSVRKPPVVYWMVALCLCIFGCAHKQAGAGAANNGAAPADPGAIQTEEVTYSSGTTPLKGFLAYPANLQGKRPGVLVVHEWWGLNDYTRYRAKKLAELGYVALALDMYGEGKSTDHPKDATEWMTALMSNREEGAKRFEAGKALLAANPHVDPTKIAAIGYCMGGAVILNMVRTGEDLPVVAVFHANLATDTPLQPGAYKGKILVAAGAADPFVPPEQVSAFRQEMDAAGANYELVEYPGVKHGFTNPGATELGTKYGIPLEYNAEADADSWARLTSLLASTWP